MIGYVLLSIVASAVASNVYFDSSCPEVKPVENFNFKAYGTGKWYELARYPNNIENGGNCGWGEYVLNGDVFSIKNFDVSKGKLRTVDGSGQLAEDAGNTGKLIYSFPYGADGAATKSTLWVLGTDYDNYAVTYYCKYNEEKKSRQDFAWVFSRSKKLEGDAKTAVDKILKDSAFLDSSKLVWIDVSDEACKVE